MQNYKREGCSLNYTVPSTSPVTTIVPGQVVVVGDLIGVAKGAGTTGDLVIVDLEGVFTLPKATPETWGTQGAKLYYDATAKKVTTDDDSGNNPQIGYVETTAGSTAAEGRVLLLRS